MRTLSIFAVAALLGIAPAAAQQEHGQHQMPMQGQSMHGMQHCMDMMGGPPPHMLLQHREHLGLSAGQVSRLETLQAQARDRAMPHMHRAMQAHRSAAELLKGDSPDFAGYESRLREATEHMIPAHTAMARVAVEARTVLTAEQQAKLRDMAAGMMNGEHGAMGGDEHGGMGAGMGGMMGCMMMDMGGEQAGGQGHNH